MKDTARPFLDIAEENDLLKKRIQAIEASEAELKQAQAALHESDELRWRIFEGSRIPIIVMDLDTFQFVDCNPAAVEIYGYRSREETIGKTPADVSAAVQYDNCASEEKARYYIEKGREDGMVVFEWRHRRPNGEIWDALVHLMTFQSGDRTYMQFTLQDITKRKQAEANFLKSETRYHLLFDHSPDGIVIIDTDTAKILEFNDTAHRQLGYTREEFGRLTIPDIDAGETPEETKAHIAQVIRAGRHDFETLHRTKQGEMRNIHVTAQFTETAGHPVYHCIWRDITERKKAQKALQESEELLRLAVESSGIRLWDWRMKTAELFFTNFWTEFIGHDIKEMPGVNTLGSWVSLIHPDDLELSKQAFRAHIRGEKPIYECEIRMRHRDGTWAWILYRGKVVARDHDGMPERMIGSCLDLTERKQAEEALRLSEATLLSVFEASPVGLCLMKGRVFRRMNKAWCDRIGYDASDLLGQTTRMLYENGEEYDRVGRALYDGLAEEGHAAVQTRLRRKDGTLMDVILTAASLQRNNPDEKTVVAIQDITDIKKAEAELKANRKRLENIIEFMPDATFIIDRQSRVVAWNRAMEHMTGVKKTDMIGKGDYEYSIPFYGERRPVLIDLALHLDQNTEQKYTAFQRQGDTIFGESFTPSLLPGDIHLSATASVLRDDQGDVVAVIECIRDNTERKKLEERLNRAEKMEALGTMAGGVAHDLNNVLGVMVGYSELLKMQLPEDNPAWNYAESIRQSTIRGAAIIQDLLTLARRGVTVSEVIDINILIKNYLKSPEFEKLRDSHPGIMIEAELEDSLLKIKGSPIHLGKTVMNLVLNAAEAITNQGVITIKTENRYLEQLIRGYDEMKEGDYVVLTVSDTGSGISPDDLGKIFEPFYTKKVMGRSGTGLGWPWSGEP